MLVKPDTDLLLVVDVQNDFCPGGLLPVPGGGEVVAPINRLMGRFDHTVLTQDWHPADHMSFASAHPGRQPYDTVALAYGPQILWPDHCVQGSRGAEFHPDLDLTRAELVLRKGCDRGIDSYSAFMENDRTTPTGLAGYMRERGFERVFLTGLAFDVCVLWSAEDAHRLGFAAVLIDDACRSLDLDGSDGAARLRLRELEIPVVKGAQIGR
ncbi:bifunctional nicotinamidase/pyrazinamidase [Chelatococcus reniformis]|uniref:Nicotinamidase n=1 Tax=Chelatococcus reniformis TaxID=1494448 RepID=A0A916UHF5_9HYPH|nr:bifunctional nicotinamidase/pyrazinamidase [Chelatococcus reniformis]GGC72465.1 nicotinamidase [Chelatococcus reniformis]